MKKKILIADDDPSILEALKIILDRAGYHTETVLDGQTLLHHFPSDFELILLDVRMSGSDGSVICKHLKNRDDTKDIPVIMISAVPELERIAREARADGFLEKPFDMHQLLETVTKYTAKKITLD